MPRSTRPLEGGDAGSPAAPLAAEAGSSAVLTDSEKLDQVIASLAQFGSRLATLEQRDATATAAAPTPQLSAPQPTRTAEEYVDWKNFFNTPYNIMPVLSLFKPDLFNLHGEKTHDALIGQNKKGSARVREYQVLYCSSFHHDAVLGYLDSITEDDARTPE